jgi:hypothetical protein
MSSRHANLPFHLYVNVDNRFLGPTMPPGTTAAIWHGVYARPYQTLYCHVLLESGAHWSGLPLHAISTTQDFSLEREQLMPWGSMGEETEAWHVHYLEGLKCNVHAPIQAAGRHTGIIIDWADGFSRYPAEHKPLNLLALESGQFALVPNNYATYADAHFVDAKARENTKHYRRGETVYWEKP